MSVHSTRLFMSHANGYGFNVGLGQTLSLTYHASQDPTSACLGFMFLLWTVPTLCLPGMACQTAVFFKGPVGLKSSQRGTEVCACKSGVWFSQWGKKKQNEEFSRPWGFLGVPNKGNKRGKYFNHLELCIYDHQHDMLFAIRAMEEEIYLEPC